MVQAEPAPLQALIALGSNLPGPGGDPEATVAAAMRALGALGRVAAKSRAWRSPAWPPGGPDYVNAAAVVETTLGPEAALERLHAIEAEFGRIRDASRDASRNARWASRTLDLDLLALGDLVRPDAATQGAWRALPPARQGVEAPAGLVLPHPRMQDRGFVLVPLAEVAPGWRHPLLGVTVARMLANLPPAAREGLRPIEGH